MKQPKGDSIQVENSSNNVKKGLVTLYFMLKIEVANLFCMSLVSACEQNLFRLYFSFTKEGCHRPFKPSCNDLVVKNVSKVFFF